MRLFTEISARHVSKNGKAVTSKFNACLLTDKEMALGEKAWARFRDPFPSWRLKADADAEDKQSVTSQEIQS
jgi:hypothetical protein